MSVPLLIVRNITPISARYMHNDYDPLVSYNKLSCRKLQHITCNGDYFHNSSVHKLCEGTVNNVIHACATVILVQGCKIHLVRCNGCHLSEGRPYTSAPTEPIEDREGNIFVCVDLLYDTVCHHLCRVLVTIRPVRQ